MDDFIFKCARLGIGLPKNIWYWEYFVKTCVMFPDFRHFMKLQLQPKYDFPYEYTEEGEWSAANIIAIMVSLFVKLSGLFGDPTLTILLQVVQFKVYQGLPWYSSDETIKKNSRFHDPSKVKGASDTTIFAKNLMDPEFFTRSVDNDIEFLNKVCKSLWKTLAKNEFPNEDD